MGLTFNILHLHLAPVLDAEHERLQHKGHHNVHHHLKSARKQIRKRIIVKLLTQTASFLNLT